MYEKNVRDLMIPIADYSVTSLNMPLKDAVLQMRKIYCEVETGKCTEAGHRTALVISQSGELVGILDFRSILKTLIPEISGGLSKKLEALGVSIAMAEGGLNEEDNRKHDFRARVKDNSATKVKDMMLKIRGQLKSTDTIYDALKVMHKNKCTVLPVFEGNSIVGVIRDSDLFLAMAEILSD